jgi:hypothetical protein
LYEKREGSGSVLVTNRSVCDQGRLKSYGSYGFGCGTLENTSFFKKKIKDMARHQNIKPLMSRTYNPD